MRVFLSWRAWVKAGLVCLPCFMLSGCKSTSPGSSWLGWMSPKSSTSSLANVPAKPSLPPPSATMASTGPALGTGTTAGAGLSGQGAFQNQTTTQPSGNNYYTGPYNMAGQAPNTLPPGSSPGIAASGYGNPAPAQQNPAPPYAGYQSPYQSSAVSAANAYRTADSRNSYGNPPANGNVGAPPPAGGPANNWSNDQWGRTESRGGSQPAGYTEGSWGASTTNPTGTQGGYAATGAAAPANAQPGAGAVPPRSNGGYRPGSTGRTTGALPPPGTNAPPAGSNYSVPNGAYPASPYPASSYQGTGYPTTSYPSAEGQPVRTTNATTGYAGGYQYPSGTQYR